jgi:hypothetical protein
VDLAWTGAEEGSRAMVERRATGAAFFVAVTGWLAPGVAAYNDAQAPAGSLEYRVRLQDGVGNESQPSAGVVAPAPKPGPDYRCRRGAESPQLGRRGDGHGVAF